MIQFQNTLLSDELIEEFFVCDLNKCKGACCVEGDLGAPLELDELDQLEESVDAVRPYLSTHANKVLDDQGPYLVDEEGDYSTTTINGRECVFAFYDDQGILKCGIEQAWKDGKTTFQKPVSCHLYPIRISKVGEFDALNYDRWAICSPACDLGAQLKVPVYKFVKDALIRKFGEEWYEELQVMIKEKTSPE